MENSSIKSKDGKFEFKLKVYDDIDIVLEIILYESDINIYETAIAIFDYCCGGNRDSLNIEVSEIMCDIIHWGHGDNYFLNLQLSNCKSPHDVLVNIAKNKSM